MGGAKRRDGDSENDSGFITPDSTTREKGISTFSEGEDVLSHGKDGLYYLGTIVVVDAERDRCLVQFEDSTAHWSLFKDITKLRIEDTEDTTCTICKSYKDNYESSDIILCNVCDQGYHQNCLEEEDLENDLENRSSSWTCPKCIKFRLEPVTPSQDCSSSYKKPKHETAKEKVIDKAIIQNFPYDLSLLTWDKGHKSNNEQTYCYCGGPGEWFDKMLQCQKCLQWFHEACIECLQTPLLRGDRLYVFVCHICNEGSEFSQRINISWLDAIHLAIFNLSLEEGKTYFHYDERITKWISENWELLQVSKEMMNCKLNERKEKIWNILDSNRNWFKCVKDWRKKPRHWGLRIRAPPPSPIVKLPQGNITECLVKCIVIKRKKSISSLPGRINFKDSDGEEQSLEKTSLAKKRASCYRLIGDRPPHFSVQISDPDTEAVKRKRKSEIEILMNDTKAQKMIEELDNELSLSTKTFYSSDLEKELQKNKTKSFNSNCDFEKEIQKTRTKSLNTSNYENSQKNKTKSFSLNSDLEKEIEKDAIVKKRGRPKKILDETKNLSLSDLKLENKCKKNDILADEPLSVASDEKSHADSNSLEKKIKGDKLLNKDAKKEKKLRRRAGSLPPSSSGILGDSASLRIGETSDDTSSRGTLDSFIPPPSNFEGNNHPFFNLDILNPGFNVPPTARPLKRKLKASDLKVGKNGEIKRLRMKRKREQNKLMQSQNLFLNSCTNSLFLNANANAFSKLTTGVQNNAIKNCVEFALNARLNPNLNANQIINSMSTNLDPISTLSTGLNVGLASIPSGFNSIANGSPEKDLKSTMNSYFGAANRIASGQRFRILAKRVNSNGKSQFLIDWELNSKSF